MVGLASMLEEVVIVAVLRRLEIWGLVVVRSRLNREVVCCIAVGSSGFAYLTLVVEVAYTAVASAVVELAGSFLAVRHKVGWFGLLLQRATSSSCAK